MPICYILCVVVIVVDLTELSTLLKKLSCVNMALLGLVMFRLILSTWHHVATAERLYGSSDNLSGAEVPTTANNICPSLCFYEIFAQHYAEVPEDGKAILPLFLQLWSQSFASQIFALLFYRWVSFLCLHLFCLCLRVNTWIMPSCYLLEQSLRIYQ